ncbi:restriction endonuclease [Planobispora longispora]|uniref:Restriction endonuclease type IV Mrr domain-containing protein n=1 Tax=Planobispora longispora TaxID=28887 RepID=A0A8J3W9E4_9ACTN|nr:restriction endonuclease [Planobispora longispora]BFE88208.1 hypothetical protein GCM10020093_108090 [Planobispora longispora]GIH80915.1 hypothetical protein Plo01_73440 [Planobispora longispora]
MVKRRSPAGKRVTRRGRKKSRIGWEWLLVPLAVFMVGRAFWEDLASSWPVLLGAVAVLAALLSAVFLVVRRMGAAYRREALRRAGLDRLNARQFEKLTAELLRRDDFGRVRVVGGAGDGGVDVRGAAPDGRGYAIQCKHYTRPVGPGAVRDFVGALQARPYRGHQGVFVTSHYLSAQAARTAREHGVIVIDRDRLADWLLGAYRLGPDRGAPPVWLARLRSGRQARERLRPPSSAQADELGLGGAAAE